MIDRSLTLCHSLQSGWWWYDKKEKEGGRRGRDPSPLPEILTERNTNQVLVELSLVFFLGQTSTDGDGDQREGAEEPLGGRDQELALGEEQVEDAGGVELVVPQRRLLPHVLVQGAHEEHGHRRVEDVVHGDEEGVEDGLGETRAFNLAMMLLFAVVVFAQKKLPKDLFCAMEK